MKLDLILENVRNKYNMGLLEESSLTELDILKGKILINESTMQIRKMLVEEGTMENVKLFLEESWSYELYEESLNQQELMLSKVDKNTLQKAATTKSSAKDYSINAAKHGAVGAVAGLVGGPIGAGLGLAAGTIYSLITQYIREHKVNAIASRYLNDKEYKKQIDKQVAEVYKKLTPAQKKEMLSHTKEYQKQLKEYNK